MRSSSLSLVARIATLIAVILLGVMTVIGSGGGGGGDVEESTPPPGGVGIGADGVTIFWYTYDTNTGVVGAGRSVQETSDGGYVVAGFESPGFDPTSFDVFLMKTDSRGAAHWKKRFSWSGGVDAFGVRQTADGGYIVVGHTYTSGNRDVYLLKTDASGNALAGWPKTYGGTQEDYGFAVVPLSGGTSGYLVVGARDVDSGAGVNNDIAVWRIDASGNLITGWPKTYSTDNIQNSYGFCGVAGEAGTAIAEAGTAYVIAGYTGCGWSGTLLKIDINGNQQWIERYGPESTRSEVFESVAVTASGEIAVAGRRRLLSGQPPVEAPADALVVKTDADGSELWRRTYGLSQIEELYGVALTRNAQGAPDGGYVVSGFTQSYGGPVDPNQLFQYEDVHLVKVDASGTTLWQKVKGNRPMGSDRGHGVYAVSDGGIAVTGASGGNVLLAKFDKNGDTINLGATDLSITVPATTGVIDFGNALDVAKGGVNSLTSPREIGGGALNLLIAQLGGDPVSDYCNGGGSYDFDPDPTLPLAGNSFVLTLANCTSGPSGDQVTINGSATVTVDAVSGDPLSPTYSVNTTITAIDITVADVGTTLSQRLSGAMHYARSATSGDFAEVASSIVTPAQTYTVREYDNGVLVRMDVIGPFTVSSSLGTSGAYSYGATGNTATVNPNSLGNMALTVLAPVAGSGTTEPASGQYRMLATDGSRLTVTITNGTAALAVDTDGDGTDDGTIAYPWEFLD